MIEDAYQSALLADAAYLPLNGYSSIDDIDNQDLIDRGWTLEQVLKFKRENRSVPVLVD